MNDLLVVGLGVVALVALSSSRRAAAGPTPAPDGTPSPSPGPTPRTVETTDGRRYRWTVESDEEGNFGGAIWGLAQVGTNLAILGFPPGDTSGRVLALEANCLQPNSVRIGPWHTFADGHRERVLALEDVGPAV